MPDTHTIDAALWRLYGEAAALVRDLEIAAAGDAAGLDQAGKFIGALNAHLGPLRAAISDVEFYREAERVVAGLRFVGSLDGIAG